MANNFPGSWVTPGTQRFVLYFVQAWLSGLIDTGNLKTQSFKAREDFIDFWLKSGFDLLEFDRGEVRKIEKLVKELKNVSLPPNLVEELESDPESIVWKRQEGIITDEEFQKYGPTLVLDYILSMSELSEENRLQRKDWKDYWEQEHAKKLERIQARTEIDSRRKVPWNSKLIQALLGAVPSDLPHPMVIQKGPRPSQSGEPWMDMDTFFEILRSGLEAVEEEFDDVLDVYGEASLGVEDEAGV